MAEGRRAAFLVALGVAWLPGAAEAQLGRPLSRGEILAGDASSIVLVDRATGDRTLVSGSPYRDLAAVATDASGAVFALDRRAELVLRLDPSSNALVPIPASGVGPPIPGFGALAVETSGRLLLGAPLGYVSVVIRVDPTTGAREAFSALSFPGWAVESSESHVGIAVEPDGQVLVLDGAHGSLRTVDAASGDDFTIAGQTPTGESIGTAPSDLQVARRAAGSVDAVYVTTQRILFPHEPVGELLRIDRATGSSIVVSGSGVGAGSPLAAPFGVVAADDGSVVWVVDGIPGALLAIDPTTGDRSVVSDATTGSGPELVQPQDLARAPDGTLLVTTADGVMQIDPATGVRTLLGDTRVGDGRSFASIASLVAEPHVVYGADGVAGIVFAVDPASGERTVLAATDVGTGPPLYNTKILALDRQGRLYAAIWEAAPVVHVPGVDAVEAAILEIDRATGDRTLVAGAAGGVEKGNALEPGLRAFSIGPDDALYVGISECDPFFPDARIVRVDRATGDGVVVSRDPPIGPNPPPIGDGPSLGCLETLAPMPGTRRLLADTSLEVDVDTGDRFSEFRYRPLSSDFRSIAADRGDAHLIADGDAIWRISTSGAERITDPYLGHGPLLVRPSAVVAVPEPGNAAVAGVAALWLAARWRRSRSLKGLPS